MVYSVCVPFCCCARTPQHLGEERVILAYSVWAVESIMVGKAQQHTENMVLTSSSSTPPPKGCITFTLCPKVGDQMFKYMSLWGHWTRHSYLIRISIFILSPGTKLMWRCKCETGTFYCLNIIFNLLMLFWDRISVCRPNQPKTPLCRPDWPLTLGDCPASASYMLGFQVLFSMLIITISNKFGKKFKKY